MVSSYKTTFQLLIWLHEHKSFFFRERRKVFFLLALWHVLCFFSVLVAGFNRAKPTESGEIKFYESQKGNLNKENIVQRLSFVIKFH